MGSHDLDEIELPVPQKEMLVDRGVPQESESALVVSHRNQRALGVAA